MAAAAALLLDMLPQHLTNPGASNTSKASAALMAAVKAGFGSWHNMTAELTTAGRLVFGSGWAWLCYNIGVCVCVHRVNERPERQQTHIQHT